MALSSTAGEMPPSLESPKTPQITARLSRSESQLGRRCFICLSWEHENGAADLEEEWVDPCPCSLAAHQTCALEWFDNQSRERKSHACPICKAEISLRYPFNPAIWLSEKLNRALTRTSPYLLAYILTSGTLVGSASYGLSALIVFAGPHDALKALWAVRSTGLTWHRRVNWGAALHLPFVGPALVLHRLLLLPGYFLTFPNMAAYSFFARLVPADELTRWPPSPWWVLALGPTISNAYSNFYREILGGIDRRLDRELRGLEGARRDRQDTDGVQLDDDIAEAAYDGIARQLPAVDLGPEEGAGEHEAVNEDELEAAALAPAGAAAPGQNLGGDFANAVIDFLRDEGWEAVDEEVHGGREPNDAGHRHRQRMMRRQHIRNNEVDVNIIVEEDENGPAVFVEDEPAGVAAAAAAVRAAVAAQPPLDNQPNPGQLARGVRRGGNRNDNGDAPYLIDVIKSLTRTLLFPGIAFAAGELLHLTLPKSWSKRPPAGLPVTGLLQEKWGRSLVGGCLYIVFRDLFRLYVKYSKVKLYDQRRIPNVKRRRGGGNNV